MHYGLLPRANRGIFAINELPDLAGKIQVGLFNILQEGDVQIKGYPVRLPLDVMLVFTANPEDYTARGKIITPLKDRIGSEIRTHYPTTRTIAMAITAQEAWTARDSDALKVEMPDYVREVVEEVAFQARADKKVDKRSGVSQRLPITSLENVISNAERRALVAGESLAVPRVTRHLRGAAVDHRQVRAGVRGRAAGRRRGRARSHPRRGRQRLQRLLRERRHPLGRRLVRRRRRAAARRHVARGGGHQAGEEGQRPARTGPPHHAAGRAAGAHHRLGDRLRPRGPLLDEEDRAQRRARLPRRRLDAGPTPRPAPAPIRCSTRTCRCRGRRSTTTERHQRPADSRQRS